MMLLLFFDANVLHHVYERGAFVGENAARKLIPC